MVRYPGLMIITSTLRYDEGRRPVACASLDGRDAPIANTRIDQAEEKSRLFVENRAIWLISSAA
jgi:hypothetical protein